jgi:release factor glutamine methyltransferase
MTTFAGESRPFPVARPPVAVRFPLRMVRLPGVYRPQEDTWLLAEALRKAAMRPGSRVLDVCTGSGALAVAAAKLGAGSVAALDISKRAVATARLNGLLRGLPVRASRGSLLDATVRGPFDVVLANPPYVPCELDIVPTGRARAWDAGPDGRALLDPLCQGAPALLARQGFLLLVQSEVSGVDESVRQLRAAGLKASVVARARIPFGPVMRGRTDFLRKTGLVEAEQRYEELVVIRADRADQSV